MMLKLISANLNGVRSAANKGFFDWMIEQEADFVCVQELKAQQVDLSEAMQAPTGYQGYFHCAEKRGYSGVGIYTRHTPDCVISGLGYETFDREGRYIRADFGNFTVISLYVPSGSSSPERQAAKFLFMNVFYPVLQALMQEGREVVICGDWNIAHREIDLKNWKGNLKNSGFLPEERAWLTQVLSELGWVDTYRQLYPTAEGDSYTWWSNRGQARANNVGWRIDYQIATPNFAAHAQQASIYKEQRFSDHAPLTLCYQTELSK